MNSLYTVSFIVTCLGSLFWGCIAVGHFAGKNFNIVYILSKGNTNLEYGIYLCIGICSLVYIWMSARE